MRKAYYICVEGTEGVGKTTQTQKLVDHLRSLGYKVLQTKEPGTPHSPLTMELRNIMLNAKYEPEITTHARELVSQAIRSIHLEKVIKPALNEHDFIVQDRGILSGLAYGAACGNDIDWLIECTRHLAPDHIPLNGGYISLYDKVILLKGNVEKGLNTAISSKKEFEAGDAIELRGLSFMNHVNKNMSNYATMFYTSEINVDGKNIEEVFQQILSAIEMETLNER
jgi:dTMP kinase